MIESKSPRIRTITSPQRQRLMRPKNKSPRLPRTTLDSNLRERLNRLEEQHEKLVPIIALLKELEGNEKTLWAKLYLQTSGTVAEREARVYSSDDWINFSKALQSAKSDFINEMRFFEIRQKAYDAEHLSLKVETPVIKRQA